MHRVDDKLPEFFTTHQSAAWVKYRDPAVILKCREPGAYSALKFWNEPPVHGSEASLHSMLRSGKIRAFGRKRQAEYQPIPPIEWVALRLAPLSPSGQYPYEDIKIIAADLLKLFPYTAEETRKGRPQHINYDFIDSCFPRYENLSLEKMTASIRSEYEKSIGGVSDSTIKRRLRTLIKGVQKPIDDK